MHRIAITGPESTGKSTLTVQLAEHFQTTCIPEYSREYLSKLKRAYQFQDVITIAKKQLELEASLADAAQAVVFVDTELINIKIWLEHKYGECPQWIHEAVRNDPYDLYLLMDVDLPWEEDEFRENPDKGPYFFHRFRAELDAIRANYKVVSGLGEKRLKTAIRFVEEFVQSASQ